MQTVEDVVCDGGQFSLSPNLPVKFLFIAAGLPLVVFRLSLDGSLTLILASGPNSGAQPSWKL